MSNLTRGHVMQWAGMQLLWLAFNCVDGFQRPVRVLFDGGYHDVRYPDGQKSNEPLVIDLQGWDAPFTAPELHTVYGELYERLRLALLSEGRAVTWNV